MGLYLSFYVLRSQEDLTFPGATAPMTRLDVIEDMRLNRLITDVGPHGKRQEGVVPLVSPRPVLRSFKLWDITHGGPEDKPSYEFDTDFYGNLLTWVYADELKKISCSYEPSDFRVRAALAYIAELPPDTPVILYWG